MRSKEEILKESMLSSEKDMLGYILEVLLDIRDNTGPVPLIGYELHDMKKLLPPIRKK